MAAGTVVVAPDSTGKKIQTFENTISALVVEAQAVSLVDSAGVSTGTSSAPLRTDPTGTTTQPVNEAAAVTVHNNATIAASGSTIVTVGLGEKEINLIVNVKASPTGTTPSLRFTLQDVDPVDQTTVIGQATQNLLFSAISTGVLSHNSKSGVVKVAWTLVGTGANFTQVFTSLQPKTGNLAIPSDAALASVNASASSVTLLAANSNRKGCCIVNDGATSMYVCPSGAAVSTATTANYAVKIPPGGYYEFPSPCFIGSLAAIWDATASGAARVTEYI